MNFNCLKNNDIQFTLVEEKILKIDYYGENLCGIV